MLNEVIKSSLLEAKDCLNSFLSNEQNIATITQIARLLAETLQDGGKIIIFGNGGSLTDAMHFAEELTGRFRKDRMPLPAICISDPSHITCVANDFGFQEIFARSVMAYAKAGDAVIGLSTSGNSQNIIRAFDAAKKSSCKTIAFLGKGGGQIKGTVDCELIASGATSDRIQEIHMLVLHILVEAIEYQLFTKQPQPIIT